MCVIGIERREAEDLLLGDGERRRQSRIRFRQIGDWVPIRNNGKEATTKSLMEVLTQGGLYRRETIDPWYRRKIREFGDPSGPGLYGAIEMEVVTESLETAEQFIERSASLLARKFQARFARIRELARLLAEIDPRMRTAMLADGIIAAGTRRVLRGKPRYACCDLQGCGYWHPDRENVRPHTTLYFAVKAAEF